jgi:thioredoxin 1
LSENFTAGKGLVLVDFYADWCEPCKWALPVIDEVIRHFNGKIVLEKVDIDEHVDRAKSLHILSVPTFILFRDGQEIWRIRGFDAAGVMIRKIESALVAG